MSNPFGESKLGKTGYVKRNRFDLKDGDNVYRILPAMGNLAEEGRWSCYYSIIWGFKSTDGKSKPFQSCEVFNRKTKTVEVRCAATDLIQTLKNELETAKKAGNKDKVGQLTKLVGDYPTYGVYNVDKNHYVNVVDRQGNVGQLALGHKAKVALDAEIERIRKEESYDPLSPNNGRFLNLRRDGKGRDTQVKVTVVQEQIDVPNVGKVKRDIVHVIDDALLSRLLIKKEGYWQYREAADLTKLFRRPSAEEVELIVKSADISTGKSPGVDKVFARKDSQQVDSQSESDEAEPVEAAQQITSNSTATVTETTVQPQPSVVAETKAAVNQKASTPAQTTAEVVTAMNPEEFMKQMGITL